MRLTIFAVFALVLSQSAAYGMCAKWLLSKANPPGMFIDEAPRTTWATELLKEVLTKSRRVYSNPNFYKFFSLRTTDSKVILRRWLDIEKFDQVVSDRLGDRYVPLLLDPGVLSRFDKFLEFSVKYLRTNKNADAWTLREAFAAHLETENPFPLLYRGIALTEAELKAIQRTGMVATNIRQDFPAAIDVFSHQYDLTERPFGQGKNSDYGPLVELRGHAGLLGGKSNFISVSAIEKVAASVGAKSLAPDRKLYIFAIKVPAISTILSHDKFQILFHNRLSVGSDSFNVSDGVEIYVPNIIPASEIVSVSEWRGPIEKWKFQD